MNIKEIKEMINLMNENNLTELEIEKEGLRVRLKKGSEGQVIVEQPQHKTPLSVPVMPEFHPVQTPAAAKEAPRERASGKNLIEIKSPMVGTFYRAPSPESPPFIEINQNVEIGQVVCIVEAMKLMNEIKSEIRGKIVDILVNNAEPVEFGQALFLVEPA
ncbi:acetyl-CoA carboxylase, biotin carboxyl carrier protein [Candidatus Velamenicoccus archaeovorus]|uniref:Biotin carboxyl carrier protein of acetyl-CoA carboxylase n=1 Tax=Velamenicoccus archaeovorus TaxID=1930593 RepID=A0A410P3Y7_VELA1|nr:acetyl-CoA carboxylase biotin carboxyl carrier protein [Candidatus Velamenicoccus archaeovorus]QAT16917.1 acetyl-CoA carboxylase, biotin carboxyl carrier protein [Candidatus Velamenicoccus archaeovorus]